MGESFVEDAAAMGFPADWDGPSGGGIPDRGDTKPIREIVSEESVTWLTEELKKAFLCRQWPQVHIEAQGDFGGGEFVFPDELMEGPVSGIPESMYYITFEHIEFHLRDFISALRHSRVPIEIEAPIPHILIWDSERQVPRVLPSVWHLEEQQKAFEFIYKSWISADHGRKLVLARKGPVPSGGSLGNLIANIPDFIPSSDIGHYQLLFHDRNGSVKSVSLESFWGLEAPVVTRTAIYRPIETGYESYFSDCYLAANAYLMVTGTKPSDLELYVPQRDHTIFEPGLKRIDISHRYGGSIMRLDDTIRWMSDLEKDSMYKSGLLVAGGHPCDVQPRESMSDIFEPTHLTTSIRHYKKALELARKNQWKMGVNLNRL
ncbi:hypothetical protein MYE70_00615 [Marinobacter alexandrii]|uniref:hypothetical protein n=1 Tax=Marinobacter alexandrii TaxID=2570351 RepID=UPI0020002E0B|nr:hypothetical protein [Marinobacter alexandrii]MCK2147559.1 hypothetical protein [Marinobacter alexandrii]